MSSEPVAIAFADKYPTGPWDFVVRNGAFSDRGAGGRVIAFRVRPMRGLGFRKGDRFSQMTWRGFRYARTPKQPRGADRPRCRSRDTAQRILLADGAASREQNHRCYPMRSCSRAGMACPLVTRRRACRASVAPSPMRK